MGLRPVPVDKLMAPGATCHLEWVHSVARKGRFLSTGSCRPEGAYSVNWDVLDDEEGEQEYNDELGQGCAIRSVIGRGSDPSWVTSVGHVLLGVGHVLPVVVVVIVAVVALFLHMPPTVLALVDSTALPDRVRGQSTKSRMARSTNRKLVYVRSDSEREITQRLIQMGALCQAFGCIPGRHRHGRERLRATWSDELVKSAYK